MTPTTIRNKIKKAFGEVYHDEKADKHCLVLRPTFLWWFTGKKISITKDDLRRECEVSYY